MSSIMYIWVRREVCVVALAPTVAILIQQRLEAERSLPQEQRTPRVRRFRPWRVPRVTERITIMINTPTLLYGATIKY